MAAGYVSLPSIVAWLIAVAVVNAVALGITFLARRWVRRSGIPQDAPMAAWISVCGALCAVIFAFAIVNLWNGQRAAESNVDREAAIARALLREVTPSSQTLVRDYVSEAIAEWPSLCGVGESSKAKAAFLRLEKGARSAQRENASDVTTQLMTLDTLRYERARAAKSMVPPELWAVIFFLVLLLVALLAIVPVATVHYHFVLMMLVATALGTVLWVASVLDFPYCGSYALQPTALTQLIGE